MSLCVTILACLPLIASCASDITKDSRPAALVERSSAQVYRLRAEVKLDLTSGRVRKPLPAGSRWRSVGTIPEGTVYKPLDHLLQIQTGHSYEGYLVCSEGQVVGVYLPVEDCIVEVSKPAPILLEVNE